MSPALFFILSNSVFVVFRDGKRAKDEPELLISVYISRTADIIIKIFGTQV